MRVGADVHHRVGEVAAAEDDLDHHLAGARHGLRNSGHDEILGAAAGRLEKNRAHDGTGVVRRCRDRCMLRATATTPSFHRNL
jgi:hypothetical protein